MKSKISLLKLIRAWFLCIAFSLMDEEYLVNFGSLTLREKCPNTKFFLVRIFLHSDWRKDTPHLSAFSPNPGKYGPEKTPYLGTFHAVIPSYMFDRTLNTPLRSRVSHYVVCLIKILTVSLLKTVLLVKRVVLNCKIARLKKNS